MCKTTHTAKGGLTFIITLRAFCVVAPLEKSLSGHKKSQDFIDGGRCFIPTGFSGVH